MSRAQPVGLCEVAAFCLSIMHRVQDYDLFLLPRREGLCRSPERFDEMTNILFFALVPALQQTCLADFSVLFFLVNYLQLE